MIRSLIVLMVVIGAITIGLGVYLQPNDLSLCDQTPGANTDCQSVDAIVAISGGDTEARANKAIALYRNGWSNLIVFSGAALDKTGPSNAAVMKSYALEAGIPESAIILDETSESTRQNAENCQIIFLDHNIKSIILVTSGYHQRRASLEFNRRTDGVTIINNPVINDNDWSAWWWTTPRGWWLAVSEFVRIIAFYFVGTQ